LDFGAGTLFWSDWFVEEFKGNVYAVDTYYKNINLQKKNNIFTYSDLDECLNSHNNYMMEISNKMNQLTGEYEKTDQIENFYTWVIGNYNK
jgi:hypothetical protein